MIRAADLAQTRHFYRDVLGLAVHREFGDPASPSQVYFVGNGLLEVTDHGDDHATGAGSVGLWLQVRDVAAEHRRLDELGVPIVRAPVTEPWGLIEMTVTDPDGIRIVIVQVPDDHPLRRDQRQL